MNENKTNINWYPGHMAKAKRQIKEQLGYIDVVYELVDARMPFSSKMREMDEIIKNKPRILIMTKIDLCDMNETKKWVIYYENQGYKVLLQNLETKPNIKEIIKTTEEMMKEVNEKRNQKGLSIRKTRVLIMGIPNVGKSTLINRLTGKKAVHVGNRPGVTQNLSWIRINEKLELLDTPGILWPKLEQENAFQLASLSAIKEEILPMEDVAIYILKTLVAYYPEIAKSRFNIDTIDEDIVNTLDIIGKKRGCLIKGGEIDYDKVYHVIINDVKNGVIKGITFDRYK